MNINLSWDLFVIVFFVIIMAYSLIIGRDNTLKVILGTYVAALAADAVGNLFGIYFSGSEIFMKLLRMATVNTDQEAVIFVKVLIFVIFVILFAVKGAFEVRTSDDSSPVVRMGMTIVYAVMSAGLVISVILAFVSGVSFIGGGSTETVGAALLPIYSKSALIRSMVQSMYMWFFVPAVAFLVHSFYTRKDE